MNPNKNFKPSHDPHDRDRDGESTGVNQVNPNNAENQGGDPVTHLQPDRDAQPDGDRDQGFDAQHPETTRRRGDKVNKV